MPKSIESQVSYSAGEWSPLMDARVDHPKYRSACRQLKNMVVLKQGGVTRMAGTRFIAKTKYYNDPTKATRLIPFKFSPTTAFVLEFGHQYIRFYSNGQPVIVGGIPLEIATPYNAIISTTQWETDIWNITACQVNDVVYIAHANNPPYKLTRYEDTYWDLQLVNFNVPPLLDQNISDTTISASATTGSVTLSASSRSWGTLIYYQEGNSVAVSGILYTCNTSHISGTFATDLAAGLWTVQTIFQAAHIGSTWQLNYLRNSSQVALDIIAIVTPAWVASKSYTVGKFIKYTPSGFYYRCLIAHTSTASFPTDLAAGKWVVLGGAPTTMISDPISTLGSWTLSTYGTWSADIILESSYDNGTTWNTIRSITGRADTNISDTGNAQLIALYRLQYTNFTSVSSTTVPRVVFENTDSFNNGLVKITAVGGAYSATATVVTQLNDTTATKYWSEAAWSDYRGYPKAVTLFQQRMVYGGTSYEPQRIWGSVTNDLENFARGDQTLATDSYAFTIGAISRGAIQWLVAQTDLFVGFSGAEWVVSSGSSVNAQGISASVTPTAINAVEQSAWGSATGVSPCVVGSAVFYTQRSGQTIQQMLFSIYTTKYMSSDLTALSEHLFGSGIQQIDYQPSFHSQSSVWVLVRGGALMCMTYQIEQEIFAWSRRTSEYNDVVAGVKDLGFNALAVINGTGTDNDQVWVIARRSVNGDVCNYVELIDPTNWETKGDSTDGVPTVQPNDYFYVDSGITVATPDSTTISGLDHLVGRSVVGVDGGNIAFGPFTVADDGTITIPSFSGNPIRVGIPLEYAVQPMRLDIDPRIGVMQGLNKAIHSLIFRLRNALGGNVSDGVGDGDGQPIPVVYRTIGGLFSLPTIPFTGDKSVQPRSNITSADPQFIIEGSDPLPLTILATTVKYDVVGTP